MSLTPSRFLTVSSLTLACRITGFATVPLVGAALGLTHLADAYMLANVLPNIIFELVLGGIAGSVFLPLFAARHAQMPAGEFRRDAAALSTTLLLGLLLVSVAACVAAPWIIDSMTLRAPDGAARADAIFFFRFFAFQIVFYGVSALASILLNIEGKFALAAGAPALNNLVVIGAFAAYALWPEAVGRTGLALATTGGVAAMALAQAAGLRRLGMTLVGRPTLAHPALRRALVLGAPLLALVAIQQAGVAVRANLASSIEGGFAALQHVNRFFQLPYGLLAVTIFTLVVPGMSRDASRRDAAAVRAEVVRSFRWTVAIMLPASLVYSWLAPWLMRVLMTWGRMDAAGAALLGDLLRVFALAVFPFAVTMLAARIFYAHQRTLAPSLLQAGIAGVQILLCLALFPVAGLDGIAAAMLLSWGGGAVVAVVLVHRLVMRAPIDATPPALSPDAVRAAEPA